MHARNWWEYHSCKSGSDLPSSHIFRLVGGSFLYHPHTPRRFPLLALSKYSSPSGRQKSSPSPAPDGAQCSCQRPGTPSLNASGRSPVSCLGASKVLHLPLCEAGSPCPLRGGLASELTKAMSSCRIPWGAASVRGYLAYRAYVLLILRYTVISSVPFCEV